MPAERVPKEHSSRVRASPLAGRLGNDGTRRHSTQESSVRSTLAREEGEAQAPVTANTSGSTTNTDSAAAGAGSPTTLALSTASAIPSASNITSTSATVADPTITASSTFTDPSDDSEYDGYPEEPSNYYYEYPDMTREEALEYMLEGYDTDEREDMRERLSQERHESQFEDCDIDSDDDRNIFDGLSPEEAHAQFQEICYSLGVR